MEGLVPVSISLARTPMALAKLLLGAQCLRLSITTIILIIIAILLTLIVVMATIAVIIIMVMLQLLSLLVYLDGWLNLVAHLSALLARKASPVIRIATLLTKSP